MENQCVSFTSVVSGVPSNIMFIGPIVHRVYRPGQLLKYRSHSSKVRFCSMGHLHTCSGFRMKDQSTKNCAKYLSIFIHAASSVPRVKTPTCPSGRTTTIPPFSISTPHFRCRGCNRIPAAAFTLRRSPAEVLAGGEAWFTYGDRHGTSSQYGEDMSNRDGFPAQERRRPRCSP